MKQFLAYTFARIGLFAVAFGIVWVVTLPWFDNTNADLLVILLIALAISSVVSLFLLRGLRDKFAANVQARAERMTQRIEESRRAEDVD